MLEMESDVHQHLERVRTENSRGIFASEGPLFKGAIFGRDSIEVAEDIVKFDDVIPREVLLTLATLQGVQRNPITEEEPGKIHHEHRLSTDIDNEGSSEIFKRLSFDWGGDEHAFTYYGSVDATPLWLRLVETYVARHGDDIMQHTVRGVDGEQRSFQEHVFLALDWVLERLQQGDSGFIEYKRTNPKGIENQVWKDSLSGYIHEDGSLLNYRYPIAPLEVQGYAYDALRSANSLFPGTVSDQALTDFRKHIIDAFWVKDLQFFASALDRDESGQLRQVRTPASNAGLLLDSWVLVDEPNSAPMVDAVLQRLMGPEFLTNYGIRCRSLAYKDLVDYPDYHGSFASWPKETSDISRGSLRHNRRDAAKILDQCIVTSVTETGEFYEFNMVNEHGERVDMHAPYGIFTDPRCNIPEPGQSWTISAFIQAMNILKQS